MPPQTVTIESGPPLNRRVTRTLSLCDEVSKAIDFTAHDRAVSYSDVVNLILLAAVRGELMPFELGQAHEQS